MAMDIPRVELSTGHEMPQVGLGTWKLTGQTCVEALGMALEMGYDHIDTADVYGNHREVAAGMRGFDRERVWITSKVNRGSLRYDDVLATCEKNLGEL
ncbi:MAG: aldo/keto reductase, partial [Armatimonadota bacterium]